jgi:surfactin synthase thioesterase subunit
MHNHSDSADLRELKRWVPGLVPGTNTPRLRLLCFPYAGAGASVFRGWQEEMPDGVELLPVQLPGREGRWHEPVFLNMTSLARELGVALRRLFDTPYVLFGHSMGGLIAFELVRHVRRAKLSMPMRLFISSARAPHLPDRELPLHHLPDERFLAQLAGRFGDATDRALRNQELARALLPILRADFTLCETYQPSPEHPLDLPVTVYGGQRDRMVVYSDLASWSAQTRCGFSVQLFSGDHFFLNQQRGAFLRALSDDVAAVVQRLDASANAGDRAPVSTPLTSSVTKACDE